MIEQALNTLAGNDEVNKPVLWNQAQIWQTLWTTLGLMPAVLLWYFWSLTALNASLDLADKRDLWLDFLPLHIGVGIVLLAVLIFVARFSPRARKANKFGLFAVGLFLCGLVVIALPNQITFATLMLIALASIVYWLTPWHRIRAQWQPLTERPEMTMTVALQLLEKISDLPYPSIREAVLPLLDELLTLSKRDESQQSGAHGVSLPTFCADLSRHFAPLLGALSYRAQSLGNDAPELMNFIAAYPPFTESERILYNRVSYYRNVVQQNDKADERIKTLWLKSALILADNKPKTSADTLYDIELMLLPLLLNDADEHEQEIALLLHRLMIRLDEGDDRLNVFQQNSWLAVLQSLADKSDDYPALAASFCRLNRRWPGHQRSFDKDTFEYTATRQQALHVVIDRLQQVGTEDEAPTAEALLQRLIDAPAIVLHQFLKLTPEALVGQWLAMATEPQRTLFYQAHQEKLDIEAAGHFDQCIAEQQALLTDEIRAGLPGQIQRYLKASERVAVLIVRQLEDMEVTNYLNQDDRYETKMENRLNRAVLQRVDQVGESIKPVLAELKQDIESQQLDLADFLRHLGYKFGALIYSIHQCFPDDVFQWLLDSAGNDDSVINDESCHSNYLLRVMQQTMAFHWQMKKHDQQGAFEALQQLLTLFVVRYPLNREASEATLVTCMQMLSVSELDKASIETLFETLQSLPEMLYADITPQQQTDLQELIKAAIAQYDLMESEQVNDSQRKILANYLVGVEDYFAR